MRRERPLVPCFKIAKLKAERMNTERAPASALDDILSQARYLLLDFDGPIWPAAALRARCGNLG
jgi:hypothetical protein